MSDASYVATMYADLETVIFRLVKLMEDNLSEKSTSSFPQNGFIMTIHGIYSTLSNFSACSKIDEKLLSQNDSDKSDDAQSLKYCDDVGKQVELASDDNLKGICWVLLVDEIIKKCG